MARSSSTVGQEKHAGSQRGGGRKLASCPCPSRGLCHPKWHRRRRASGAGRCPRSVSNRKVEWPYWQACHKSGRAWPWAVKAILVPAWVVLLHAWFGRFFSSFKAPSDSVQPGDIGWVAFTGQKGHRFIERQARNGGIGADELLREGAGKTLQGVAASLASPLA